MSKSLNMIGSINNFQPVLLQIFQVLIHIHIRIKIKFSIIITIKAQNFLQIRFHMKINHINGNKMSITLIILLVNQRKHNTPIMIIYNYRHKNSTNLNGILNC
jgi:hypothetical protein